MTSKEEVYTIACSEAGDWYVIPRSKRKEWRRKTSFNPEGVEWAIEVELSRMTFKKWRLSGEWEPL